jgi:hypothetical protein
MVDGLFDTRGIAMLKQSLILLLVAAPMLVVGGEHEPKGGTPRGDKDMLAPAPMAVVLSSRTDNQGNQAISDADNARTLMPEDAAH